MLPPFCCHDEGPDDPPRPPPPPPGAGAPPIDDRCCRFGIMNDMVRLRCGPTRATTETVQSIAAVRFSFENEIVSMPPSRQEGLEGDDGRGGGGERNGHIRAGRAFSERALLHVIRDQNFSLVASAIFLERHPSSPSVSTPPKTRIVLDDDGESEKRGTDPSPVVAGRLDG